MTTTEPAETITMTVAGHAELVSALDALTQAVIELRLEVEMLKAEQLTPEQ